MLHRASVHVVAPPKRRVLSIPPHTLLPPQPDSHPPRSKLLWLVFSCIVSPQRQPRSTLPTSESAATKQSRPIPASVTVSHHGPLTEPSLLLPLQFKTSQTQSSPNLPQTQAPLSTLNSAPSFTHRNLVLFWNIPYGDIICP